MSIPPATITHVTPSAHDRHPRHRREDVGQQVIGPEEVVDPLPADLNLPADDREDQADEQDDHDQPRLLHARDGASASGRRIRAGAVRLEVRSSVAYAARVGRMLVGPRR